MIRDESIREVRVPRIASCMMCAFSYESTNRRVINGCIEKRKLKKQASP